MPETVRTIDPPFTDVPGALDEIRAGRMVIVVDDEDRENEGDLTLAAEHVTPDAINFMARYGRGLICLALTEERADHLRLFPMTQQNSSRFGTAFTETIEAREGVTTGISAADRAMARVPDLIPFCKQHGLLMLTVAELIRYRLRHERYIVRAGESRIQTKYGQFRMIAYESEVNGGESHIALVRGELCGDCPALIGGPAGGG